jgi:hypothetical protein
VPQPQAGDAFILGRTASIPLKFNQSKDAVSESLQALAPAQLRQVDDEAALYDFAARVLEGKREGVKR